MTLAILPDLSAGSPAINAGNNADVPSGVTTDLAGNPRIIDGVVDMGAYESPAIPAIFVDASATGNDDGSTWADAYTTLTEALANDSSLERIDIAAGTYYPTTEAADRTISFVIPDGLTIYGGYKPGAAPPVSAMWQPTTPFSPVISTAHQTPPAILIMLSPSPAAGSSTLLDGLTITDGNANAGSGTNSEGGGLFLTSSSPTINDCIIENNAATNGGGVYDVTSSPTFTDSSISNNTSTSFGAGIYNASGTLTLENSTVSNNSTPNFRCCCRHRQFLAQGVLHISDKHFQRQLQLSAACRYR